MRVKEHKVKLKKIFGYIMEEMGESEEWSIDKKNHIRELSLPEMIERNLMDGYCHSEDTGERTIIIKYKIKKKGE